MVLYQCTARLKTILLDFSDVEAWWETLYQTVVPGLPYQGVALAEIWDSTFQRQ